MDAVLIFEDNNEHPLSALLRRGFRHVWCATLDKDRRMWTAYDWRDGRPVLTPLCPADFDIVEFYREQGCTVVEIEAGNVPQRFPIMMNNCVSHVRLICGIDGWAITPYQLYKRFTRRPFLSRLFSLPGLSSERFLALPMWTAESKKLEPTTKKARDRAGLSDSPAKAAVMKSGARTGSKSPPLQESPVSTKTLLGQ